tara:strand:+ start:278 stop:529 length:252 start_codon:yes stop_codon:yes gene_type:complete
MDKLEKKIKDLKEFIKEKTDQGTANYLGKEIREICGIVKTEQLTLTDVVLQSEQLMQSCSVCDMHKHPILGANCKASNCPNEH